LDDDEVEPEARPYIDGGINFNRELYYCHNCGHWLYKDDFEDNETNECIYCGHQIRRQNWALRELHEK